jgi:hypothetical protein
MTPNPNRAKTSSPPKIPLEKYFLTFRSLGEPHHQITPIARGHKEKKPAPNTDPNFRAPKEPFFLTFTGPYTQITQISCG